MALLLLLVFEVFLGGYHIGVQSIISLILHDFFVVGRVHVPSLVAIVGVEWRVRSLIRFSLQFRLLLDLLLFFLFLLLVGLLLRVLGWLFVHGPGAFLGLLVLEVRLRVSDVLVERQANGVLDNLLFFVLGPWPWLAAPARGGADWIRFGRRWSWRLLSSGSFLLLFVSSLGLGSLSLLFLLGVGGMARLPLFVSDQSGFFSAIFIITTSSGLSARMAFLPLLVVNEAGLLPL